MLQAVLGCAELNWDLVAKHLGRGKRSVQRKYDNLRTGMQAAGGRRRGGGWGAGHQCVRMGGFSIPQCLVSGARERASAVHVGVDGGPRGASWVKS